MNTPLTVQLAESFGSKPVRKTLRQLVDELVGVNIDGAAEYDTIDHAAELANKAEAVDAEINRRLRLIEDFHGTEATRIRSILDTGLDEPWWQK